MDGQLVPYSHVESFHSLLNVLKTMALQPAPQSPQEPPIAEEPMEATPPANNEVLQTEQSETPEEERPRVFNISDSHE